MEPGLTAVPRPVEEPRGRPLKPLLGRSLARHAVSACDVGATHDQEAREQQRRRQTARSTHHAVARGELDPPASLDHSSASN